MNAENTNLQGYRKPLKENKNGKDENGKIIGYHVQIRIKGTPPQYASFKRKTDADRWIQQTEAAIREDRHF